MQPFDTVSGRLIKKLKDSLLTSDTVFFRSKNYKKYEDLGIYVCGARITAGIKKIVADLLKSELRILKKSDQTWEIASFNRFPPNAAFFYMMITASFIYETFKQDVLSDVFPAVS